LPLQTVKSKVKAESWKSWFQLSENLGINLTPPICSAQLDTCCKWLQSTATHRQPWGGESDSTPSGSGSFMAHASTRYQIKHCKLNKEWATVCPCCVQPYHSEDYEEH